MDLLSPCSGDENLSDEDDDTPAATPLCSIRTPLSHYPNLQKTQSATHARVGWKKVDFLLSPSFWAEIFSEQPPRGVVPAARSTGRRIPVHKKQQLLDCLYVYKCREVRTRLPREETYSHGLSSPGRKPRSTHPLFSIQCSMAYEYQRAVDWLPRVSTGGPSWRFREKVPTCLPPRASPLPPNVIHPSSTSE